MSTIFAVGLRANNNFWGPRGRQNFFTWKVMPFGLCNTDATFQRVIQYIFSDMKWKTLIASLDLLLIISVLMFLYYVILDIRSLHHVGHIRFYRSL